MTKAQPAPKTASLESISGGDKCRYTNEDDGAKIDDKVFMETKSKSSKHDINIAIETRPAPDGGWGWFVLLGAIVMRIITSGMVRSNGLFYVRYLERFGGTAAQTAWITSLNMTCNMLMGPIVSILCNRFPARTLSFFGALLFVTSLIISGFSTSLVYMYFSYGVLGGIGRSFMASPVTILLGYYFEKRRSVAFGLAAAGMGIGGFTITPTISILFDEYGFTGTFIFLAGIALHTFVCVLLFRPIEAQTKPVAKVFTQEKRKTEIYSSGEKIEDWEHVTFISEISSTGSVHLINQDNAEDQTIQRNEAGETIETNTRRKSLANKTITFIKSAIKGDGSKKALFSFSVFKDIRFLTMLLATFLQILPTTNLFLPALAKDRGITDIQTGLLLSIIAITDTVTKVVCGFVLDLKPLRRKRPYIYNAATFLQCFAMFIYPSATTLTGFVGLCCLQGFCNGVRMAQRAVILVDILGVDKLTSSNALIQLVTGIGTLIGPPVSGLLRDTYGKYDYTFYFGGTASLMAAMILAWGNIRNYCAEKSRDPNKQRKVNDDDAKQSRNKSRESTKDDGEETHTFLTGEPSKCDQFKVSHNIYDVKTNQPN